jgi:hypothetical protein
MARVFKIDSVEIPRNVFKSKELSNESQLKSSTSSNSGLPGKRITTFYKVDFADFQGLCEELTSLAASHLAVVLQMGAGNAIL